MNSASEFEHLRNNQEVSSKENGETENTQPPPVDSKDHVASPVSFGVNHENQAYDRIPEEDIPVLLDSLTGKRMDYFPDLPSQPTPERKKRKTVNEQQVKRQKYDVLKAFFRVYFAVDEKSAVLKDAIYNLYTRKISKDAQIARNAMYRHMWTVFKEKNISASQSNYREYVKGLKLLTSSDQAEPYEGYERDVELLHSSGVSQLFDFTEEDLAMTNKPPPESEHEPDHSVPNILSFSQDQSVEQVDVIPYVEQLETIAQNLLSAITSLKMQLKKSSADSSTQELMTD